MAKAAPGMNLFQVNLFVNDFSSMLRFYRDALGFETNDIEPGPLRPANRDAVQLCFIVDDVERERKRLIAVDVACDPVVAEGWGRYAAFRDPEGNWLQIFEVFDRRT